MENLKEAMEFLTNLSREADKPQVLEICGKTYANRNLTRYDKKPEASPITARTLSSMVDYIEHCNGEFPRKMIIQIKDEKKVLLMSALDDERDREVLFTSQAETSEFRFDQWYDQERFMIELQANFQENEDREILLKMAGNVEKKNDMAFSDDGKTQVATMQVGIASKADVIVPNPVTLIPFRTFQEIEQPESKFVFRIGNSDTPAFKLIEAEGGIWKTRAVESIKEYFFDMLRDMPAEIGDQITIIG